MLVSTFELLVNPIAPPQPNVPPQVARTVVQGYFLTIANTSDSNVRLRLRFTATTPELNIADTVIIRDVTGNNVFRELTPVPGDSQRFTFNLTVPAHDTVLVTLLPDLNKDSLPPTGEPDLLTAKSLEIRGYVEIFRASLTGPTIDLLLTPEHRGTFLPINLQNATPDFDQLVYTLPTPTGGSLFRLRGVASPGVPSPGVPDEIDVDSVSIQMDDMQQLIVEMAQRIEGLEQRLTAAGQSFISPEERSIDGEPVLSNGK